METSFGDIGTDLLEDLSFMPPELIKLLEKEPPRIPLFAMQNAGLEGVSRDTVSLLSITATFDIVGLSAGLS
jgi:hypothetical protein